MLLALLNGAHGLAASHLWLQLLTNLSAFGAPVHLLASLVRTLGVGYHLWDEDLLIKGKGKGVPSAARTDGSHRPAPHRSQGLLLLLSFRV